MRSSMYISVGILAFALASCSSGQTAVEPPTTSTTSDTASISTTLTDAPVVDSTFVVEDLIVGVQDFSKTWNDNNVRWITALTDPNVSYAEYLVVQQEVGVAQGSLVAQFDVWVASFDATVQPALDPLLENYRNRYRIMIDEVFPAALGDDDAAFEAAAQRYLEYSLPENLVPALRAFFLHPVIADAIRSEGADPQEVLDAMLRTFGVDL